MSDYNYDNFATDDYDFKRVVGPQVGQKAPDFELLGVDGEQHPLLDFEGDFLVLEMGSITCPLFQGRRKVMSQIDAKLPNVSSAVLYVREAHPGLAIASHKNIEDKKSCALRLKQEDGEKRQIFIDDFEGQSHRAYGAMPNAVFIINKAGCVVFRSEWNNPKATTAALKALIAGHPVRAKSYFLPAPPWVVFKTLVRGGKGAFSDFLRGLPKLFWNNLLKRNLSFLFGRKAMTGSATEC